MATQQQAQQQPQSEKSKSHLKTRFIIAVVIVALIVLTVWILSILAIIPAIWATIASALVAVLGAAFTFLPLITSPDKSEQPPTPHINVQVQLPPLTPETLEYQQRLLPTPNVPPTSYRGIIGLPPPTDPKTIQQRQKVVKEAYDKLTQQSITAIALTGIGGIGKSTLAALIYRYAEEQRQTGRSPFTAQALWLTVDPAVTFADLTGTVVGALGKPLLDVGTLSPQSQAAELFNALNTVDKPRLVIIDQFENFLDWQTGQALPDRVGVGEWIDALNSQPCHCHVLLTSRPDPQGTRQYPPTHLQTYQVEGLKEAEGIELLRKQGVQGAESDLRTAVIHCAGHAYALTLLASLIRTRKLSLSTLLKNTDHEELWSGKVAENILNSIYKQLDELRRNLLVGFSVYREAVSLDAALAIIDTNTQVSKAQAESLLDALLAQHLVQASEDGCYQLHVIVASYAQDHCVEGDEWANQQALKLAHTMAAQHYLQRAATNCPLREQRRQMSDVHDLIEAIWQYCQAEQWEEAFDLMEQEGLFSDLNRWGGNTILLELYLLLLPDKWHPNHSQAALIYNNLGETYLTLSKDKEALPYLEQSLRKYRKVGDRKGEGEVLCNLGSAYNGLRNNEQALSYYQQALVIRREVDDRRGEGTTLSNLGTVYSNLGNKEQALFYYQQALVIRKEVGDRRGEGVTLANLGSAYSSLGDTDQALSYLQQALVINREVGDRSGEGFTLLYTGIVYFKQTRNTVALAFFLLAKSISEEVQSPYRDNIQEWIDGLHQRVGKERFATLLGQVEPQAHQIVEQALHERLGQV